MRAVDVETMNCGTRPRFTIFGVVPAKHVGSCEAIQLPKRMLTDQSGLPETDRECQIGQRCPFLFLMVPLLPHMPLTQPLKRLANGD